MYRSQIGSSTWFCFGRLSNTGYLGPKRPTRPLVPAVYPQGDAHRNSPKSHRQAAERAGSPRSFFQNAHPRLRLRALITHIAPHHTLRPGGSDAGCPPPPTIHLHSCKVLHPLGSTERGRLPCLSDQQQTFDGPLCPNFCWFCSIFFLPSSLVFSRPGNAYFLPRGHSLLTHRSSSVPHCNSRARSAVVRR